MGPNGAFCRAVCFAEDCARCVPRLATNLQRQQDVFYGIAGCSANPKGRVQTWEWFKLNFDRVSCWLLRSNV